MAIEQRTREGLLPTTDVPHQLMDILGHDFTTDLSSTLASLQPRSSLRLKINAEICIDSHDSDDAEAIQVPPVHMVSC